MYLNDLLGDRVSLIGIRERNNPLDVVERVAIANDWPFERLNDAEITLFASGDWANYQVSFTWMDDTEVLHLACAFKVKVPQQRLSEVQRLVAAVNEQLWIGHFDVWIQNDIIMFRHALLLVGGALVSPRQCEAALGCALDTCESYYPAFQFVLWSQKSAREAMETVMFKTSGRA